MGIRDYACIIVVVSFFLIEVDNYGRGSVSVTRGWRGEMVKRENESGRLGLIEHLERLVMLRNPFLCQRVNPLREGVI